MMPTFTADDMDYIEEALRNAGLLQYFTRRDTVRACERWVRKGRPSLVHKVVQTTRVMLANVQEAIRKRDKQLEIANDVIQNRDELLHEAKDRIRTLDATIGSWRNSYDRLRAANKDLEAELTIYHTATFWKRMIYLWRGTLKAQPVKMVTHEITCECGRKIKTVLPDLGKLVIECIECGRQNIITQEEKK